MAYKLNKYSFKRHYDEEYGATKVRLKLSTIVGNMGDYRAFSSPHRTLGQKRQRARHIAIRSTFGQEIPSRIPYNVPRFYLGTGIHSTCAPWELPKNLRPAGNLWPP